MEQSPSPRGPAVAAATAVVVAFFAAAVLPGATWPVVDGDTWWHIRAGQEILTTGVVPRVDTWSIVGAGRPWTSQDWLANVVLAAGFQAGPWGLTALSLSFAAVTLLAFWILWRAIGLRAPESGWLGRVFLLSMGLVLAATVLGVRVQVVDLLMTSAVVWSCWRYLTDPRRRWLAGLPLIAVAWANLHAGWLLIFLIGGAVLVGEAVDRLRGWSSGAVPPLTWGQQRDLLLALGVSAAALVLNPNGIALYRYPFDTVAITALNRYILEWFPATLDDVPGQLLITFTVAVVVPTLIIGARRLRTADLLILVGLTAMAFQAIRFLLIVGPVGAAIAVLVLPPWLSGVAPMQRGSAMLSSLSRPRTGRSAAANAALIGVVALLGVTIAIAKAAPPAQARAIAESLPAEAVGWLEANDVEGPLFNRYEWGGYIGQQRPHQRIFMDGRADVYGDALLHMYVSLITLQADPQSILDEYGIQVAIYPPATPLGAWFDRSPQWQRVHTDAVAGVWRRR